MTTKFKVWCKGTNSNTNFNIKKWFKIDDYILNKYFPINRFFENQDEEIKESFNLIQFTGLYDKEGREIYEDDILETEDRTKFKNKEESYNKIQFRVYKTIGGFAIKIPGYWKDISDLKTGDELIIEYLANPQNISWIKDNCIIVKNYNEL